MDLFTLYLSPFKAKAANHGQRIVHETHETTLTLPTSKLGMLFLTILKVNSTTPNVLKGRKQKNDEETSERHAETHQHPLHHQRKHISTYKNPCVSVHLFSCTHN